jgi:hypothetical protein
MTVRCFRVQQPREYFLWLCTMVGICGAVIVTAGCHKEKPVLVCYPVTGRILVNGKPPLRAEVRLRPKVPIPDPLKRSIEPYAYVNPDGSFEVGTYSGDDGAPPGDYAVTLTWPKITIEGGEESIGPDQLKGKFANPEHPITRVHVEENETRIPLIKLQAP